MCDNNQTVEMDGRMFREIKTADINKYMRDYNKKNYNKNKKHIRRVKNTRNLLNIYNVREDVKNDFGEYLYDCKNLIDILQEFPPNLLQYVLDDLVNDGDKIFIKKNVEI